MFLYQKVILCETFVCNDFCDCDFHLTVKRNSRWLWFCITMLSDWFKTLALHTYFSANLSFDRPLFYWPNSYNFDFGFTTHNLKLLYKSKLTAICSKCDYLSCIARVTFFVLNFLKITLCVTQLIFLGFLKKTQHYKTCSQSSEN